MPNMLPLLTGYDFRRDSRFAYQCKACGRCCRGKLIPVNPYEIASIAEHLSMTTTQVLARYTSNGGATLKCLDETDACAFFGERGCEVHPARPLACRLYPLGRQVTAGGEELFAEVVSHPQCEALREGDGTVADWLAAQGAAPFLEASERYVALLRRMVAAVGRRHDLEAASDRATEVLARAPREDDGNLLDVDVVVRAWCEAHDEAVPADVAQRVALHIRAIEEWIEGDAL